MKKSTQLIFVLLTCFVVGNSLAGISNSKKVSGLAGSVIESGIVDGTVFQAQPPCSLYVNEVGHVDVDCNGSASGSIDISPIDGTAPFSFSWSNGATTEDVAGLVAGIYTVTVTDDSGCVYSYSTQIFENTAMVVGLNITNASCNGNADGSALLTVSGGTSPYSYLWSNGNTSNNVSNLTAGAYSVVITDQLGCSIIQNILITQPTLIDANVNVFNASCYGSNNGQITLSVFGGSGPYTYSWNSNPVQTTASATGLVKGTYTCNVTDATGCERDFVIQVNSPDSLYALSNVVNVSCNGGADGEATVIVSGGTSGYGYLWSNGQTTNTATSLTAGTYVVTITDANACQLIQTLTVNQPASLGFTFSQTNPLCFGNADGIASVNVTGGVAPYSYLWNTSPAQVSSTATGLSAGTYYVIVNDANGCSLTGSVTLTNPSGISVTPAIVNVTCNGASTGSISLNIGGGVSPYSLLWSTGSTSFAIGSLAAGTYTATITDAIGCNVVVSYTITQSTLLSLSSTSANVTCYGTATGSVSVTPSGGVSPYSYNWSNGATTSIAGSLMSGVYTVTVTDNAGCTTTASFNISQPTQLTCLCNSSVTNVSCFGGSNGSITALPSGGTAPYAYSWKRLSPSISGVLATTQTINGLSAGIYEVTITDANGCTKISNVSITEPQQLLVFLTGQNVSCNSGSNGQASAQVFGGVLPYSYNWNTSPAQTTSIATGLGAGTYSVVVTDANGCTSTASVTITQPTVITVTSTKTNVSCNGGTNGTATANPTGGASPYSYSWSNGKTTKKITGLSAGVYTVTVADANGCTKTKTVTITQPSKLVSLYMVSNVSCYNGSNGAIDLTVTGGTAAYTYFWNNGATTQDLTGISAGKYTVTVTDANGCVLSAIVSVTQPKSISVNFSKVNVNCFGGNNGAASATVSGGKSPYQYLWSNGQTNATATGLLAGAYVITITDFNGCTKSASVNILQPSSAVACNASVIQNVTCAGGSNGKISVSTSGGTAPYSYLWNTSPATSTAIVNNVIAGTYVVIITDNKGCTSSCSVTVTQPSPISIGANSSTNVSCFGGSDGTATLGTVSGGTTPYTYLWSTFSANTGTSVSGLSAGVYFCIVTDAAGCTQSSSVIISQPANLILSATHSNNICFGSSTANAQVNATGGTPVYSYTLNPGSVTNGTGTFSALAAGLYNVVVTDFKGCTASIDFTIGQPNVLSMGSMSSTDVLCFGYTTGTATAGTISGGTAPYSYSWSTFPVQNTATATGLGAGNYFVIVTDVNGCTTSGSADVNGPATALTVNISNVVNIACNGGGNGSAEAIASGGVPPYSYLWSNGQTTAIASNLISGVYIVTATDANGCSSQSTVTMQQAANLVLSGTAFDISCFGGTDGAILATVTGGNPPYNYSIPSISQSNLSGLFFGLTAGSYQIFVTDDGGCSDSTVVSVAEPSQLILNLTKKNLTCNGGLNGRATAFPLGGVTPYSYFWSNGATTQQANNIAAGTYTVVVTDAHGCTISSSINIGQPAAIVINQSQTNVTCAGAASGSATANVSGGISPYNYLWSSGHMNATVTGLAAGIYTVTVTDFRGCTATSSYTIISGNTITANPAQGSIACNGGTTLISVNPAGGSAPYTYNWLHDGLNTTNSAVVAAGSYQVIITDASGCSTVQNFTVSQPNPISYGSSSTSASCFGATNGTITVAAAGGTSPYSYTLGGNTNNTGFFASLASGPYSVTITDANGCSTIANVVVTEPAEFQISMSSTPLTCGLPNGDLQILVSGGTPPFTYVWSNGSTGSSINGLSAGTYTVTVNDAGNCGPLTASATLISSLPVSCSIVGTDATCNGYQNGSASVLASGGSGGYTYLWNTAPVQVSATATGLGAGVYSVIVTDITGCSSTCSVSITEPAPLVFSLSISNIACSGANSGQATVNVFGGTVPYNYLWANGQTTATATGLGLGNNYFTITDANGCQIQGCAVITQSPSMTCNTSSTPASCGQANGTATVNVFGGTAPYNYNWNNGQNNPIATGLVAGTYSVVVTDANGCYTTCTVVVQQPSTISFVLNASDAPCNGGSGSALVFGLSGGVAPYSYLWSNGDTNANQGALAAGTYTLTITDAVGCTASQSALINQPSSLEANTSVIDAACFGSSNGSASVTVTGGVTTYTYVWNTGASLSYINSLAAGTYTVTVTDNNGCTSSASMTVNEPAVLDTLSTSSTDANCGLSNGSGSVFPSGGTAPYSYSWNTVPVQTSQTATGLASGNSIVIVTDANGCSISVVVNVAGTSALTASLNSATYAGGYNVRCNGGSDGSINLTVAGANGPLTYNWSNGSTAEDLFNLQAGTYTVVVSDGACTATADITLTESPAIVLSTSQSNVGCFGGNNGSAVVLTTGGVAPYSYSWSNGETTQAVSGLIAGTYSATVSDANGCTQSISVIITAPLSALNIQATFVNPSCNGGTNGSIDITVSGGTSPYTYQWIDGSTSEDRSGLGAGSWTVTATDANGCQILLCVVLVDPPALVISTSASSVNCSGGNNGNVSAAVSGGTAPYSYLWNNGNTSSVISNLVAGTYTVTVTDANGCTFSNSASVTQPTTLSASESHTDVTVYGGNDGTASVSASGGTAPYTYSWNTVPVKTTVNVNGLTAGNYVVTVIDFMGCATTVPVVINQPNYLCASNTPFRTETASSWAVLPNGNPAQSGQYLANHFASVFPSGIVVGGGCGGSKTLSLTSSTAVRNFLNGQPTLGSTAVLTTNLVNPTSGTFLSALAANCVSLTLNTRFDSNDPNFAPVPTVQLKDLVYGTGPLSGLTVGQILNEGNKKLGGCASIYTTSQLNQAMANIDSAYKGGFIGGLASLLSCPAAPPKMEADVISDLSNVSVYPNPTAGILNMKFSTSEDGKVVLQLFDLSGRIVWNTEERAFVGDNFRTYDFSNVSKGIYLLNIVVNNQSQQIRVAVH